MKSKKNLIIIALVIVISLFGITYAFFDYYRLGANQKITAGKVNLILNDGTTSISLPNIFPETVASARKENRTDNIVTFTVSGANTTTDHDIYYEIMLNEGDPEAGMTRFNPEDLVFDLIEIGAGNTETYLVDAMSFSDINARRIWVDTITKGTSSTESRTYKLRMWLSEDVLISDSDPNANYPSTGYENHYASVKVSVYGDFEEKSMVFSYSLLSLIEDGIDLTDSDEAGTRFVHGSDVDNNYVWYSGKLWRIVSIDKDGNIKLVTQNPVTSIAWEATSSTPANFSTSQVYSWLNSEFLPTLHLYNTDELLVNATWDYATYEQFPASKLSSNNTVTGKVGLLDIYEFMMTGGTASSSADTFLNNGYWWTMSPSSNSSDSVWNITSYSQITNGSTSPYGIRPSINLKSGVMVIGDGTQTSPYLLINDKSQGKPSELLSNRVSGEYISFNDVLYRIVGIEEINGKKLTKVTMADYTLNNNTLTTSLEFGSSTSQINFVLTDGIGLYLDNWYNADSTNATYQNVYIDNTYKKMIATASDDKVVWYQGPTNGINGNYTLAKEGSAISATIGLGRYGEMFSSHFNVGSSSAVMIWLLTKSSSSNVYGVNTSNTLINATYRGYSSYTPMTGTVTTPLGVRPSFYLKSNVVIGDADGDGDYGTGMPHDPYELVQLGE